MEPDPALLPAWRSSWTDFTTELRTYFGPSNPVGNAEIELPHLTMPYDSRLSEYLVRFNTLASQVAWGDAALRFQFYDGLPDRLKDRIAVLGKPNTLRELVEVTTHHNTLHWEQQAEWKLVQRCNDRFPPQSEQFPNNRTWAQPRGWPLSHRCLVVQE